MISRMCAYLLTASIVLASVTQPARAVDRGQVPLQVGVVTQPCTALEPPPPVIAALIADAARTHRPWPPLSSEALTQYRAWQSQLLLTDFSGLCHYDALNAALPRTAASRIVFFGDSITEFWGRYSPDFFKGAVVNRGISGQTSQQMLGRFRADVIALQPVAVQILAGTNDIAGNTGPTTLARVESNIETMVDLARAHHIAVILATIPPTTRFDWRPAIAPAATIAAYNRWIADFARRKSLVLADYHAVLDDGSGRIRDGLSDDGVHPNALGYACMEPLAKRAIADLRRLERR